jgi:hypothetical protein
MRAAADAQLELAELRRTPSRNGPKRGSNNAPSVNLADFSEGGTDRKPLFSGSQGYAAGFLETFRTVTLRTPVNKSIRAGVLRSRISR